MIKCVPRVANLRKNKQTIMVTQKGGEREERKREKKSGWFLHANYLHTLEMLEKSDSDRFSLSCSFPWFKSFPCKYWWLDLKRTNFRLWSICEKHERKEEGLFSSKSCAVCNIFRCFHIVFVYRWRSLFQEIAKTKPYVSRDFSTQGANTRYITFSAENLKVRIAFFAFSPKKTTKPTAT